ncbi:Protein of unknown function [Pyronema omphalodes CBS 100304]|uniref:Uncharacterized protein n=1 Tax=Pyronema omphalodes (strain CBS 100304) TaxID=1076935 RepID=U4L4A9_PYROM|nr:Protein of unknown function [Pyronema omphalodes CBS 100304]
MRTVRASVEDLLAELNLQRVDNEGFDVTITLPDDESEVDTGNHEEAVDDNVPSHHSNYDNSDDENESEIPSIPSEEKEGIKLQTPALRTTRSVLLLGSRAIHVLFKATGPIRHLSTTNTTPRCSCLALRFAKIQIHDFCIKNM